MYEIGTGVRCACGAWADPDWGVCYECFCRDRDPGPDYPEQPYPEPTEDELTPTIGPRCYCGKRRDFSPATR